MDPRAIKAVGFPSATGKGRAGKRDQFVALGRRYRGVGGERREKGANEPCGLCSVAITGTLRIAAARICGRGGSAT